MAGGENKCPGCSHPHDMHMPAGALGQADPDPGGCKMLRRVKPDELPLVLCTCSRTPDTFLAVAR